MRIIESVTEKALGSIGGGAIGGSLSGLAGGAPQMSPDEPALSLPTGPSQPF